MSESRQEENAKKRAQSSLKADWVAHFCGGSLSFLLLSLASDHDLQTQTLQAAVWLQGGLFLTKGVAETLWN